MRWKFNNLETSVGRPAQKNAPKTIYSDHRYRNDHVCQNTACEIVNTWYIMHNGNLTAYKRTRKISRTKRVEVLAGRSVPKTVYSIPGINQTKNNTCRTKRKTPPGKAPNKKMKETEHPVRNSREKNKRTCSLVRRAMEAHGIARNRKKKSSCGKQGRQA